MRKRKMTAKKAEILTKLFGPPAWAQGMPDEVVVLEGYESYYTHRMPEHNTLVVFSDEQIAEQFIEALEDETWRTRKMTCEEARDIVLGRMPLVDALMLLDIPERPILQQVRFE